MTRIRVVLLAVVAMVGIAVNTSCSRQIQRVVLETETRGGARPQSKVVLLDQVDHSPWDELLARYVDQQGMVDYAAWKASDADRDSLKRYLVALSAADPGTSTSKNGKLAFWINAYNALTVYGILEVYPTDSIRDHTARIMGYNIWDDLLLPVGDKQVSLNQIEHEHLREMGEPRIHFAIVCASVGCPRLLNEAYDPERIGSQLAGNTRDFFARARNFQVDLASRTARVSSILDWYGDDFGATPQAALASVVEYIPNEAARKLIANGDFTVSFLDYDWSLNRQ